MTDYRYVPAAGRRGLTRLYDPVLALTMRERRFRGLLADQVLADLPDPGGSVLDVGCGTGTLAILLRRQSPRAAVTGLDGDEEVLGLARAKPGADTVTWRSGLATAIPAPDATFDRVVMSLVLHHLTRDDKAAAIAEAARVLRGGGRLHVADWGRPRDPLMHLAFLAVRTLDGFPNTSESAAGTLPDLIRRGGFAQPELHTRLRTAWGSLELLSAARA